MMLARVLEEYMSTPWAMQPEKLAVINALIAMRCAGERLEAEEIAARINGREASRMPKKAQGVAILPVYGVIANRVSAMSDISGGTSIEKLTAQFRDAVADPSIGTILLDIDSPGGSVHGVQELAGEIYAARSKKHITAQVNPLAASAAYWLAAQAHDIAITPSGSAGSIGVFMTHQDVSRLLDSKGVTVTHIAAGKYKVEASEIAPLADEARAHLQDRVNQYYEPFVGDVARGRGVTATSVRNGYGEGRTLSARDAVSAGLVDRIATFDETVSRILGGKAAVTTIAAAAPSEAVHASEEGTDQNSIPQGVDNPATAENTTEVLDMSTQATAVASAADVNVVREAAVSAENKRITSIRALASAVGMADKAAGWIAEGRDLEAVSLEIKEALDKQKPAAAVPTPGNQVELNQREQKQYSMLRAIASMSSRAGEKTIDAGFEREVSDTIAKKLNRSTSGLFVPTNLKATVGEQYNAVLTGGTAPGTNFVQTQIRPDEFIELLRNKLTVMRAGARKLGDLQGNVQVPKQTGAATLSWTGENPGSAVTATDQTTGNVTLSPKQAMGQTVYSRQFVIQSSLDAEQFVRDDLAAIFALGLDLAALNGSGSANQPKGILNQTGVNLVAIGTNGGAITWNLIIDAQTALENNNVPLVAPCTICTPGIKGKLRKTAKLSNTIAEPIWQDGPAGSGEVAGFLALPTAQLPSTLTKGTGTNLHAMIIGDFAQLIVAEWGALELIAEPYTQAGKGNVVVTGSMLVDIAVRYAAAFSIFVDIDPTL